MLDPDEEDESEPRGQRGSYVHYLKARAILAERFGATPQEVAKWIGLGKRHGLQVAGGLDGYLDPDSHGGEPPRFHFRYDNDGNFDYFPQLMNCYVRADDLAAFEPRDRYLTFDQVVQRFKRFCDPKEAADLVKAKAASGELHSFHPLTGGTAESKAWGNEEGFPPLTDGMFTLAEVLEVEAKCAPVPFQESHVNRRADFVPLTNQLDGRFDVQLKDLPEDLRERVRVALQPDWDQLSPRQRRVAVQAWDYQQDPAGEEERRTHWEAAVVGWRYWRAFPTLSAKEFCVLRHVHDPRNFDGEREVSPGGEGKTLGRRVDDDMRLIIAHGIAAREDDRLSLGKWMSWAQQAGFECPSFMREGAEAESSRPKAAKAERAVRMGISPKEFIAKYAAKVRGGEEFLDKWFKGKRRKEGEKPGAAPFRIPECPGRYNELEMIAALRVQGRFSEIGY